MDTFTKKEKGVLLKSTLKMVVKGKEEEEIKKKKKKKIKEIKKIKI